MNAVAERYVHLVLALGQHDPDYVDAFYGPTEWKAQAENEKRVERWGQSFLSTLFPTGLPELGRAIERW
jgi:hypothetical protein